MIVDNLLDFCLAIGRQQVFAVAHNEYMFSQI